MKYALLIIILALFINCDYKSIKSSTVSETTISEEKDSLILINFKATKNSFAGFNYLDKFGNFKQIVFEASQNDTSFAKAIISKEPLTLYYAVAPRITPFLFSPVIQLLLIYQD